MVVLRGLGASFLPFEQLEVVVSLTSLKNLIN